MVLKTFRGQLCLFRVSYSGGGETYVIKDYCGGAWHLAVTASTVCQCGNKNLKCPTLYTFLNNLTVTVFFSKITYSIYHNLLHTRVPNNNGHGYCILRRRGGYRRGPWVPQSLREALLESRSWSIQPWPSFHLHALYSAATWGKWITLLESLCLVAEKAEERKRQENSLFGFLCCLV